MSSPDEPKPFRIADHSRTDRARGLVDRLIAAVVATDERPYIVTDDATVFEITSCSESEIVERLAKEYGTRPSREDLALPLWRLAELLSARLGSN